MTSEAKKERDEIGYRMLRAVSTLMTNEQKNVKDIAVFWNAFTRFFDEYVAGEVVLDNKQKAYIKKIYPFMDIEKAE